MPMHVPSPMEWEAYFPHRFIRSPNDTHTAADIVTARYAEINTTVTIAEPWPGIDEIDPEEVDGTVHYQIGRWYIDDLGIGKTCLNSDNYVIALDRLLEHTWISHMLEKTWLYDPHDFIDALEQARRMRYPDKDEAWLDGLFESEAEGLYPFRYYPSRKNGGMRTYRLTHMNDEERQAFFAFLSDQNYSFTI